MKKSRKGMSESVSPIKDQNTLDLILNDLQNNFTYGTRNKMIFLFSYYTLLRMVDVLKLTMSDVYEKDGTVKRSFTLSEQKTRKNRTVYLDVGNIADNLTRYYRWLKKNHISSKWLFPVVHPAVHMYHVKRSRDDRPLSRHRYYLIMKKVQHDLKLPYSIGNHTARKSGAYKTYVDSGYNIGLVMDLLNHSSQKATLHYLGLSQKTEHEQLKAIFRNN